MVGAVAPAATLGWLLYRTPDVLDGHVFTATVTWAPSLSLDVPLRLDGLALLAALVVAAVGALVLQYSRHYLAGRHEGTARLLGVLVLFAGSMLGLVLADHLLALYVFWELTTVCSFLLIGAADRDSRRAAMQALVITSGGGFAMLLGLVMLGHSAGDYRISAIIAEPPSGRLVEAALVLLIVGAVAKSAQVPLTSWLPAAMVAPTPVSAYLHAAAMVKAGVYLIARFAPAFDTATVWRPVVIGAGLVTLFGAGWWAVTQHDLKRLLAFGTASQLGLLFVLLGAGTRTAALAGATMFLAHAAFKSTLFLVVGAVEHQAGTRDLRELSGVRHTAPGIVAVAGVACVSMAGLPPTVGYLGKEAAYEAFVEPFPAGEWILAGMVAGSALTVAYTLRFIAALLVERGGGPVPARPPAIGFLAAPALLSGAGLALGLVPALTDDLARLHAHAHTEPGEPVYELALWHGATPALALSVLTVLLGVA
ncbi:proton-conducting transporter membrane subunit, partial [Phytoactinopolyspora endophytica]|uniref:proton-conducting transporter transmembrane domain-containing protein n=1 Tax=Phytoactinopolyspora endophytica TaxID=1642495 RepID=UPI0023EA7372